MSFNKSLKSLFSFTALAIFAFSIAIIPASSALSGGASVPTPQDNGDEGKCSHLTNPADKSWCLKTLVKQQKTKCDDLKAKKEAAKYKACVETLKNQGERLKKTNERLKVWEQEGNKNKPPKDYAQCTKAVLQVTDPSKLQSNIRKSADARTKTIDELQKQVDSFKNENAKVAVTQALNNDKLAIALYQKAADTTAKSESDSSISGLQKIYCESIFKLQINNFRKTQIKMLKNIDAQQKYDLAREKLYNDPWNLSTNASIAKNPLKTEITERLDQARELTRANIVGVTTAYVQTAGAKITAIGEGDSLNYTSDLSSPKAILTLAKGNRANALRQYNEAQVLRKVSNDYSKDQVSKIKFVSIALQNKNGDTIKPDGTVVVKPKEVKDADKTEAEGKCADLKKPSKERKHCLNKYYGDKAKDDEAKTGEADPKKVPNKPRIAYVKVTINGKEYDTKVVKNGDAKAWAVVRTEN